MRIVIAVGGNALLRRGDPMTTEVQRRWPPSRRWAGRATG
jgi:carbamate kinase